MHAQETAGEFKKTKEAGLFWLSPSTLMFGQGMTYK